MKERPILMSAPMVRACLDGSKTQTRRVVKPQPFHTQRHEHKGRVVYDGEHRMWCWNDLVMENILDFPGNADRMALASRCPYGAPGDLLWVRETFGTVQGAGVRVVYRADGEPHDRFRCTPIEGMKWTPGIFMRRADSRLTLRITDVRVERLQEISEADAQAEGRERGGYTFRDTAAAGTFRLGYSWLWESINGEGSWDANPWVWVIGFEKVKA